jgi:hypothetical protein
VAKDPRMGKKDGNGLAKPAAEVARQKAEVLRLVGAGESTTAACAALGFKGTHWVNVWRRHDDEFKQKFEEAVVASADIRRARHAEKSRAVAGMPSKRPPINPRYGNKRDDPQYRDGLLDALRGAQDRLPMSMAKACDTVGLHFRTVKNWRAADANFDDEVKQAIEAGIDRLEDEATRRAVEGVEKPVYQSGELVGHVTEYSDSLLAFLLTKKRYNETTVNQNINSKVNHSIDITKLSDDEVTLFERMIAKSQVVLLPSEYTRHDDEDTE